MLLSIQFINPMKWQSKGTLYTPQKNPHFSLEQITLNRHYRTQIHADLMYLVCINMCGYVIKLNINLSPLGWIYLHDQLILIFQ